MKAYRLVQGSALLVAATAVGVEARADSAEDFLEAAEFDLSEISNVTTEGALDKMVDVRTDLGILSPEEGSNMGWMYTGNSATLPQCTDGDNSPGGEAGDTVAIEFDMNVPATANSFIFSFYFMSREYPVFVGSSYNDTFTVNLSSAAWNGNIVFDAAGNVIDVNNALFVVTSPAALDGTGFDCGDGGGTGWVSTIAPVEAGETLHIRFEVGDVFDGIYDSGVLVDDFYWSELDPKQPYTGEPLQVYFLSPKRGSVEGGEASVVYGTNFTSDSLVYFDGVQVTSSVLSDERIQITTPTHDPGYVDVTVKDIDPDSGAVNQEVTLVNGYTYYDTSSGEYPPEFSEINPDFSHIDGGETVTVAGDYFQPGAVVYFDGIEGTAVQVLNEETITVVTPAHEQAVVDVVVMNPDGQVTDPPYPFTYTETEVASGDDDDDTSGGGDDDGGDPASCSCGVSGANSFQGGIIVSLALLGMVSRRRRPLNGFSRSRRALP